MEKKFKKVSLPLSALMATLITGTAWADFSFGSDVSGEITDEPSYVDAHKIRNDDVTEDETIFNFKAGTLTDNGDNKFIGLVPQSDDKTRNIIINIEKNGTLKINSLTGENIINIYNHYGGFDKYNINLNGNLDIYMDDNKESSREVIFSRTSENTLTVNGDLKIKKFNQSSSDNSVEYEGIYLEDCSLNIKNDFSIDSMQIKAPQAEDVSVYGIYHETWQGNSSVNLGTSNGNNIIIQNINVSATNTTSDNENTIVAIKKYDGRNDENSALNLNGATTIDNITAETGAGSTYVLGLWADNGIINAKGDLTIKNLSATTEGDKLVKALCASQSGVINVNPSSEQTVKIDGDIATYDDSDDADYVKSKVNINLSNADSYINGAINGNVDLNMTNGSVWRVQKGVSTNDSLVSHVNKISGDGGEIEIAFDANKKSDENPHLYVNELEGTHYLTLNNTNANADIQKAKGLSLVTVTTFKNDSGFEAKPVEGGVYWTNYKLKTNGTAIEIEDVTQTEKAPDPGQGGSTTDPSQGGTGTGSGTGSATDPSQSGSAADIGQGQGSSQGTNPNAGKYTTTVSTLLSTVTAGYDTWRNDADKLNERMGELRLNGKNTEGVWVRTKGSEFGRHSTNGAYTNKQQTYQIGYDAVTSKNEKQTTYTGVAAKYGKGDLTFERGNGTMKSAGVGVYQTQTRLSGHYLDMVYEFDKFKNNFHVADTEGNPISGKYTNKAMSVSAEYGRRNALKHNWYIEPQAELTVGYMWGNDFTTSNHIRVEQKNMPALIGRLGLSIGRQVSDKVNFYVKASINHDFLGNYDVKMTDLTNGDRLSVSDKYSSSWFDYGAGLSVKTSKNSYAYFDIERAVGGEYKKNWDWNAGLRWTF